MASIGHVAVALAAAANVPLTGADTEPSRRIRLAALWSVVAMLPDLDAIGFAAGVPYEAAWGHRGATHSLAFALVVALGVAPFYRRFSVGAVPFFAATLLVAASHPLLDAMTTGGLGVALWWPFSDARIFFPRPWRVIPVAPIGLGMLTRHGLGVLVRETILFAPVWLLALRPWRLWRARRA